MLFDFSSLDRFRNRFWNCSQSRRSGYSKQTEKALKHFVPASILDGQPKDFAYFSLSTTFPKQFGRRLSVITFRKVFGSNYFTTRHTP